MSRVTKRDRLLSTLRRREGVTIRQAARKFGFASDNSVTSTISKLRREGFNIVSRADARRGCFVYTIPASA